jgi:hypothetical protein
MKIYALAFAILTLWSTCASAQLSGYRGHNGYVMVRAGNRVAVVDERHTVIAKGTARGGVLDLRLTDGSALRLNSKTGRIHSHQDGRWHDVGKLRTVSPDFQRFAK